MALITKTSRYDRGNHRHQGFRPDGSPEDVPVCEVSELASELELEMVMECHGSETGKPAQMAADGTGSMWSSCKVSRISPAEMREGSRQWSSLFSDLRKEVDDIYDVNGSGLSARWVEASPRRALSSAPLCAV